MISTSTSSELTFFMMAYAWHMYRLRDLRVEGSCANNTIARYMNAFLVNIMFAIKIDLESSP